MHGWAAMDRLLQEFEQPIRDRDGLVYRVYLYGRSRPGDTWQGWLVFERGSDQQRLSTPVETTQPNAEAVLYWATGLTDAYVDGALERAKKDSAIDSTSPTLVAVPEPVVGGDSATHRQRLADLESAILDVFRLHGMQRLLTQTLFDELPHAHADIVRALEDLEKQRGLVSRRTEEGNDWVVLL